VDRLPGRASIGEHLVALFAAVIGLNDATMTPSSVVDNTRACIATLSSAACTAIVNASIESQTVRQILDISEFYINATSTAIDVRELQDCNVVARLDATFAYSSYGRATTLTVKGLTLVMRLMT
jgi:hypothetical protein